MGSISKLPLGFDPTNSLLRAHRDERVLSVRSSRTLRVLRPPLLLLFRVFVCCCYPESCLCACSGAGPRLCAARNPSSLTNSLTHTISLAFESSPELSAHVSGTQPGMGRVRRIVCVGVEKEPQRRRCFSGDCRVPWPETYPHRAARTVGARLVSCPRRCVGGGGSGA